MKNYEISLAVNANPVKLTGFPRDFLTKMLIGAASSLKGVNEIDRMFLTLRFGKVKMSINDIPIALGPFPTLIMGRTLLGTISTLKGVEGEISNVEISLQVKE